MSGFVNLALRQSTTEFSFSSPSPNLPMVVKRPFCPGLTGHQRRYGQNSTDVIRGSAVRPRRSIHPGRGRRRHSIRDSIPAVRVARCCPARRRTALFEPEERSLAVAESPKIGMRVTITDSQDNVVDHVSLPNIASLSIFLWARPLIPFNSEMLSVQPEVDASVWRCLFGLTVTTVSSRFPNA